MAHDPVGHEAAVRATGHTHSRLVHEPRPLPELVERGHQVLVVAAAPVTYAGPLETLTVAVRAARVGVEDQEAHPRQHLELVKERPAVLAVGAAVNLHYQRVLPCRVEARGLEYPALDLEPVRGIEDVALRRCHEPVTQPRVGLRQAPLPPPISQDHLAGTGGVRDAGSDPPATNVEVVDALALTGQLDGHATLQVDRVQLRHALPTRLKVETVALV